MTSVTVGCCWIPSIPVSSAERTVPGLTSHVRLSAWRCPTFSQPASCAVWRALASRPAATTTRAMPVTVKKRERLIRTPPR